MRFDEFLTEDVVGKSNLLLEDRVLTDGLDFNKNGELSLKGLLQAVQITALKHLEAGGAPVDDFINDGVLLFVIRLTFRIYRMPRRGEALKIKAWFSYSVRRGVVRYHTVENESGELLAQTASRWVCVDKTERKLLPSDKFNERWKYQYPEMSVCPAPRIFKINTDGGEKHSLTVNEEFLDMNGHVNNCEYGGFVDRAMEKAGVDKKPTLFRITYNSEARLGDVLEMKTAHTDDSFSVEASHGRGTCFRALVNFSEDIDDGKIFL